MPELNFTPEQRAAIDTRGSTVLVSAAAGSGKTRVLTERLMAYLTDAEHPVDIDISSSSPTRARPRPS